MQGDPLVSCITSICHYNEDCADHEACDRLNRICRPVCDDDSCAELATCIGKQHQPRCECPFGMRGNPFIECKHDQQAVQSPECVSDGDCASQLACINSHCVNPCAMNNICAPDQQCRVLDTLPLRTIMCQCPPDTVVDQIGRCAVIVSTNPQCKSDNDCNTEEKCINGNCMEACRFDRCGVNALCKSFSHQAICTCAEGYTGNPHYECTNIPRQPTIVSPECYNDNDCSNEKACRNEVCVNPCREDSSCAVNAFCSVNNHKALCRCPPGYEGNPNIECIARKYFRKSKNIKLLENILSDSNKLFFYSYRTKHWM